MGSNYYDSVRDCKICGNKYDTWNDYQRDIKAKEICEDCEKKKEKDLEIKDIEN